MEGIWLVKPSTHFEIPVWASYFSFKMGGPPFPANFPTFLKGEYEW